PTSTEATASEACARTWTCIPKAPQRAVKACIPPGPPWLLPLALTARDDPERLDQSRALENAPHRTFVAHHGKAPRRSRQPPVGAQQDMEANRVDEHGPAQVQDDIAPVPARHGGQPGRELRSR